MEEKDVVRVATKRLVPTQVESEDLIQVNVHDLAKWILELRHLRQKVDELQERGTAMALARQRVSAFIDEIASSEMSFVMIDIAVPRLREANRDS